MNKLKNGDICWIDLATNDLDNSIIFYKNLFDWNFKEVAFTETRKYNLGLIKNQLVMGLYEMSEKQLAEIPPHWLVYFKVDNLNKICEKAEQLGGTILRSEIEVLDYGKMAVIKDPSDAFFAIWEPGKYEGFQISNELNSYCWAELLTGNVVKVKEFYSKLFGWEINEFPLNGVMHYVVKNEGREIAGITPTDLEEDFIPPNWSVFMKVDNIEKIKEKTGEESLEILRPITDIGFGRIMTIMDPQGAFFSVFETKKI